MKQIIFLIVGLLLISCSDRKETSTEFMKTCVGDNGTLSTEITYSNWGTSITIICNDWEYKDDD